MADESKTLKETTTARPSVPPDGSPGQPGRCPLCDAPATRRFLKEAIWVLECGRCGHRFADLCTGDDHVLRVYDDTYFFGGGAGYDDYLAESAIRRRQGRDYARVASRFLPAGTLLDVGAAAGFVLQGFLDAGWEGEGLEPNATMASFAERELGLTMHVGCCESFQPRRRYELVTMIQVIGHLVDVRKAVQSVASWLEQDGVCLVESWNARSWLARACGRHWHEYSPPSVLHWFSPGGLERLFAQQGFELLATGRPAKRISGGHAKSLLRYKLQRHFLSRLLAETLRVIPDRLVLPYPAFDLFWAAFRKTTPAEPGGLAAR